MRPGAFVGSGYQCDVFAWGNDKVVKIFKPGANRAWIENEAAVTRLVHEAGLPVPAVGDIVEIHGRSGIIYERIEGPLLASEVMANPKKICVLAREMAELHALIHSKVIPSLPSQRVALERAVAAASGLTPEMKDTVLDVLGQLPDGYSVCHGDLNLNNIIMSPNGMVVIDWDNARTGSAMADVARSVLMMDTAKYHFSGSLTQISVSETAAAFRDAYLARYFEIVGNNKGLVEDWMVPVAAARIREDIMEEQDALLAIVRNVKRIESR